MSKAELPEGDSWLDADAESGETAVDVRDAHRFLHVVNEHPREAGEMAFGGELLSEMYEVDPGRRVLMVVPHDDLDVAEDVLENSGGWSHKQICEAVADGFLTPIPYPSSLVAPVPDPLLNQIHKRMEKENDN